MSIKLYSTHCMICDMMEGVLKLKNIDYELIDDIDVVEDIARKNDIENVPFAEIEGKIYNIKEMKKWIKNY